jgi:Uma2 family endonuclease
MLACGAERATLSGPEGRFAMRPARKSTPEPGFLERLPDVPPVRVPVSAGTPRGFAAWAASSQFPRHACVSYLGDTLDIDFGPGQFLLRMPASATTLDGFRAWATSDEFPNRGRISFLGREILIDMSPEELETHNKVKTAVCGGLGLLSQELDLGEFYSDRTLVTYPAVGLSTEPDGVFVSYETSEAGRVQLVPRRDAEGEFMELRGSPDWVLEVVSRYSVRDDTVQLRELYHRARIPEYWLIDARGADILFQILTRRRADYAVVRPRGGWHKSRVFPANFRLERQRNRVGRWKYTLQVQRP